MHGASFKPHKHSLPWSPALLNPCALLFHLEDAKGKPSLNQTPVVWSQERQVVLADRSSSRSPDSSAPSILLLELRSQPSNLGQRIWGQQGREANGAHATVSLL